MLIGPLLLAVVPLASPNISVIALRSDAGLTIAHRVTTHVGEPSPNQQVIAYLYGQTLAEVNR